jgi:NADH-quinone oxidoreductase subunit E
VLSLLWRAQKQNDYWLPKPAIEEVARMLGMPYIRVLEVATFYTMFNLAPVGRFFIQMCGTTPCVLAGSDAIKQVLTERIGPQRTVTADGTFSWLEVECLGACCNAPMVQINDDYYEDLTPENLNKLLDDLAAGRSVTIGQSYDERTPGPAPTHDAATRRTERSAHSIATPDQTVDTGTRRTDAAVSLDGHNREKMAQAEAMRAPAGAPSVPPGHEPKAKD